MQVLPRNDADIVAVRRGCKFTGWTGVSYDGEKIVVDAWQEDYWVVFARWRFLSDILIFDFLSLGLGPGTQAMRTSTKISSPSNARVDEL